MISPRLVKYMELGTRQMTFGFDNRTADRLDSVFTFIEKKHQAEGPVPLEELISPSQLLDAFGEEEILQTVFWLAEERKVHFSAGGRIVSHRQTKKILTQSPGRPVSIVINRPVDGHRFSLALNTGAAILPALDRGIDQYAFSRLIFSQFKTWQEKLAFYAPRAEQPFFPGKREIRNGRTLLARVLENQDAHSLILSCVTYQSRLIQLAETLNTLTRFYDQDLFFWQEFIERMQAFQTNREEIRKDEAIFETYRRLSAILESPFPFLRVEEAKGLLKEVQAFHERIEHKKLLAVRSRAMDRTDKMVQKLISLFDTFESDLEYRNQCLHDLRSLNRRIGTSRCADEIRALLDEAKDLFVDVIEDI